MDIIGKFLTGGQIKSFLNWSFSAFCLIIALVHIWLASVSSYPGVVPALVFAISAILFCPPAKAPNWMKFLVGTLLAVST